MTEWMPAWKTSDDAIPTEATYDGPDDFNVEVSPAGLITVGQDDWLSKYALAIHGDVRVLEAFLRARPGERWVAIPDDAVDRIFTGETLLHWPSCLHAVQWYERQFVPEQQPVGGFAPPPAALLPTATDWNYIYSRTANVVDVVGGVVTTVELVAQAKGATVVAANAAVAGTAITLLGVPLFLIGSVWDLVQAHDTGIRVEMMLATAYAATAWTFDDLYKSGEPTRPGSAAPGSPALRFPVPAGVADALHWRTQVYKGRQNVEFWVDRHAAAWVETTEFVIGEYEAEYQRTLHVGTARKNGYRGPNFTRRQYREELRRTQAPRPGAESGPALMPYWVNRTEYYDEMIRLSRSKHFSGWFADKTEERLFDHLAARLTKPRSPGPGSTVP